MCLVLVCCAGFCLHEGSLLMLYEQLGKQLLNQHAVRGRSLLFTQSSLRSFLQLNQLECSFIHQLKLSD